jgi:phytoene dehydrogenase-like protein
LVLHPTPRAFTPPPSSLQRNGVDVLVLEARERVGGRVHSYQGPGFSAPVDLGASLLTGTAPDAEAGLGPDPVSFVCRQLGIQLHELGGGLPLFDAQGQQVTAEVDAAVDK